MKENKLKEKQTNCQQPSLTQPFGPLIVSLFEIIALFTCQQGICTFGQAMINDFIKWKRLFFKTFFSKKIDNNFESFTDQ